MNRLNILTTVLLLIISVLPMTAKRQYNIIIEDLDGNSYEYNSDSVQSFLFDSAPVYNNIYDFVSASYDESNGLGNYYLELSDGKLDEDKNPTQNGGIYLYLSFTVEPGENNTQLNPGYYVAGCGRNPLTFDVNKMIVRINDGEDINDIVILDGTIDVRRDNDNDKYDIRIEAQTYKGPLNIRYIGNVII